MSSSRSGGSGGGGVASIERAASTDASRWLSKETFMALPQSLRTTPSERPGSGGGEAIPCSQSASRPVSSRRSGITTTPGCFATSVGATSAYSFGSARGLRPRSW